MVYLGIDIGASFIKGAILDLTNLKIKKVVKYSSPLPVQGKTGRFEVNPDLCEETVRKIIYKLANTSPFPSGIVLSTQMHGIVLVDESINSVTDFIGWQDERVMESAFKDTTWLELIENKLKHVNTDNTGIKFRPGIMGSTLFWLKENGFFKKGKRSKALFLGDYIAAKVSSGMLVTHPTNASGSGLFNVEKNIWNKKILKALGIEESLLPKVVPTGTVVGNLKFKNKNIPIFVSVGDMQAAVLGSLTGLEKNKEYCINIGTGSQISTVSKEFKTGDYDIRSYFDDKYLQTVTHIPAGRALNTLIKFVEDIGLQFYGSKKDVWEKIVQLASKVKDSGGIKVNISFFKLNATGKNSGDISKITETNLTIGNVFYEALSDMVENYLKFYKKLGGKEGNVITLAGGLARKIPLLQKMIKDGFKSSTIRFSVNSEETLAGLFILALFSSKKFTTVEEASNFVKKNKLKLE